MKLTNRDFAAKGRSAAQGCSIFFFCGQDEAGNLVFAATVTDVMADGTLVLQYDIGGEGVERITQVEPRVRMPWHPTFLRGVYTILLRRNLGHGRTLEG